MKKITNLFAYFVYSAKNTINVSSKSEENLKKLFLCVVSYSKVYHRSEVL